MTVTEINILLAVHRTNLTRVADELNINRQFLSNIINGSRDFKQPAVRRAALLFALRFNEPIETIFDGVEPASQKEKREALKALKHLDLVVTT